MIPLRLLRPLVAAAVVAAVAFSPPRPAAAEDAAERLEAAARLARAHEALLSHARADSRARAPAVARLAARAWAYRALLRLSDEEGFETVAASAPAPEALHDLAYLCADVPGREADVRAAIARGRRAFAFGEDLLLEAHAARRTGRSADIAPGGSSPRTPGTGEDLLVRILRANPARAAALLEAAADGDGFGRDPARLVSGNLAAVFAAAVAARTAADSGPVADPRRPNPGARVRVGPLPRAFADAAVGALLDVSGAASTTGNVRLGVEVEAGANGAFAAVRLPDRVPPGPAALRILTASETSAPAAIEIVEWPPSAVARTGRAEGSPGADAPPVTGAPAVLIGLAEADATDSVAAVILEAGGRTRLLTPVSTQRHPDGTAEARWRIPADLPPGRHVFFRAARAGGTWGLDPDPRPLHVEAAPRAPSAVTASHYLSSEPHFHLSGGRVVSRRAAAGDLVLESPDLLRGEWYRLAWTGGGREIRCETDGILVRNVGAATPETAAVAAVAAGRAGAWSAATAVEPRGTPPAPPVPPPVEAPRVRPRRDASDGRPPAVRAVEWFVRVGAALERLRDRLGRNPTEGELLAALRLETALDAGAETWPRSPWGGPWSYRPTPGHRSAAFLARDTAGRLAAQWHDGEVSGGLVEYAALGGEAAGVAAADLLWAPPWREASLGPFAAEALRAAAGAEIGLVHALALRGNLPRGPVSRETIGHALPANDRVALLEMRGQDLREILIRAADEGRSHLHAAGAKIGGRRDRWGWDPTYEITATGGAPLDDSAVYRVALPAALADGADGYVGFRRALRRTDLEVAVRTALAQALGEAPAAP